MLDGLAALTGRLNGRAKSSLDAAQRPAVRQSDAARHELRAIGKVREEGLGRELGPVVIGFTGLVRVQA